MSTSSPGRPRLYDELVVAVLVNPGKAGLFSVDERMELLREAVADLPNVTVDSFEGLLVDYCRAHDIPVIVKGLRAVSDFEYELQMAQMNRELAGVETLFVPTAPQVGHLSSSLVKQIAIFGGDVSRLVPKAVNERLLASAPAGSAAGPLVTEVVYRLYETVDELTTVIENARSVPMSGSCMVPRDHLLDLLDDLRESLPEDVQAAGAIVEQRTEILQQAQAEAERLTGAHPRRERAAARPGPPHSARSSSAPPAVSATSCSPRRQAEAEDLLADAEAEAERLIAEGRRTAADGAESPRRAAEHERLITETEVYRGAVSRADELGAQTAPTSRACARRSTSTSTRRLADFGTTLERMLRSVEAARTTLRGALSLLRRPADAVAAIG